MTGTAIINHFKLIVGDDWEGSDIEALLLADQAKDTLETEIELQILLTEDSTLSRGSADTDTTSYTVPTAASTIKHLYLDSIELDPISFHERYLFTGISSKYTIDWGNRKFYILGGGSSPAATIHIFYIN